MKTIKAQAQNANNTTVVVLNLDGNSIPLYIEECDDLIDKLYAARQDAADMIDERNKELGKEKKPIRNKLTFIK
jgi:hypothetical protein